MQKGKKAFFAADQKCIFYTKEGALGREWLGVLGGCVWTEIMGVIPL